MAGEVGRSGDGALTEALTDLKRQGCNLLVVGTVTGDASEGACRRMLGDDDSSGRRRLLAFTDADGRRAADRLPGDCDGPADENVTLVEHAAASRSSVATGAAAGGGVTTESPDGPTLSGAAVSADYEVDATNLTELGDTLAEALAAIESDAGELAPAELRLCFDSLLPLLESNGEESVFRFLHVLTGHVRQKRGMAHYHLPVDPSASEVHLFAPLFDAVVELRTEDGHTQQRWHVDDADVSTDWLTV